MDKKGKESLMCSVMESNRGWTPLQVEEFVNIIEKIRKG